MLVTMLFTTSPNDRTGLLDSTTGYEESVCVCVWSCLVALSLLFVANLFTLHCQSVSWRFPLLDTVMHELC